MHDGQQACATQPGMQLLEAVCAKLCHDLSSPLGTLLGALEMVADDPDMAADALPIASDAAAAMGARLKLLRAAWAGDGGPLSVEALARLGQGLPPRVALDLHGLRPAEYPSPIARTLLNLVLLGAESLPRGGTVVLAGDLASGIMVQISGSGAAWPDSFVQAVADGGVPAASTPRHVQLPLAILLARAAGVRVSLLMPSGPAGDVPPLLLGFEGAAAA